jgi:hypothetical protein
MQTTHQPHPPLKAQLLQDAEQFCRETGLSKPQLGEKVVGDRKFFRRIEGGAGFTDETFDKFQRFFAEARMARAS